MGYSASAEVQVALKKADTNVGDWRAFGAYDHQSPSVGVILYPGGHVPADAYALTAQQLAQESATLVAVVRAIPDSFSTRIRTQLRIHSRRIPK